MSKPKDAKEMRELVLKYIDALLQGGIPKIKLDEPKEAPDVEKTASELYAMLEKVKGLRVDDYQTMLSGISLLYGADRESATERCYDLFYQVQQLDSVTGQLTRCYDMVWMLDYATGKSSIGMLPGIFGGRFNGWRK